MSSLNPDLLDPAVCERMRKSKQQSLEKSGRKLNIFITSNNFPSISLTGSRCQLNCKHCGSRLLSRLIPSNPPERLEQIGHLLANNGAKGMLITGGCDTKGKVPTAAAAQYIKSIKQQTDLIVIAHTGFITPDEARTLKDSGLDGIAFDVVGDAGTLRRVYGLDVTENDYLKSGIVLKYDT